MSVSDKRIAIKFAVSVRSVSVMRRRMGLKKDSDVVTSLRKGVKKLRKVGSSSERVDY